MKVLLSCTFWIVLGFFGLTKTNSTSDSTFFTVDLSESYSPVQEDSTLKKSMERGAIIYQDFCLHCHMADGKGVSDAFPPLAKADYLKDTKKSILAVKNGLSRAIVVNGKTYTSAMPNPGLYPDEVADVMNYIRNSWGNDFKTMITEKQVENLEE